LIEVHLFEPSRFSCLFAGNDSIAVCIEEGKYAFEERICATGSHFLEENVSPLFGENNALIFFTGDGAVLIEIKALEEALVWEFLGGDDAVAVAVCSFEESDWEGLLRGGSE
jgi:hypothetical protein